MILTAYLDDSGTHDGSEWVTVGGFLASADQWEAFDSKWTPVVKDEWGLDYFHMADFERGFGPYADWTDQQHHDRLNYLLDVIRDHTMASVAVSIPVGLFNEILGDQMAQFVGGPYGFAALECSAVVPILFRAAKERWGDAINLSDAWVAYEFESGTTGRGKVLDFFERVSQIEKIRERSRVLSVGLKRKQDFSGLQAADILAYEVYKEIPRHTGTRTHPRRYPLRRLAEGNCQWMYHDEATIARIAPFVFWASKEGWH